MTVFPFGELNDSAISTSIRISWVLRWFLSVPGDNRCPFVRKVSTSSAPLAAGNHRNSMPNLH